MDDAMSARDRIIQKSVAAIFGKPLVVNVYRSILVEAMVAECLPDWEWCSTDYSSFDFRHADGTRLEVKQTAFKQSWTKRSEPRPSWDIKPRKGAWQDGSEWVPGEGRNAEIYVFGLHDVVDDAADHREPSQWKFFVIAETRLPQTQRISLKSAMLLTECVRVGRLSQAVHEAHTSIRDIQKIPGSIGEFQSVPNG